MTDPLVAMQAGAIWSRYAEQRSADAGAGEAGPGTALTVRLNGRQAGLVAEAAAREGRSRGAIIRKAVDRMGEGYGESALFQHVDVAGLAEDYLASQGVDVAREMASVEARDEGDAYRARAAVDRALSVAVSLKKAEAALLSESRAYLQGATGYTRATLAEAQGRADHLAAALAEACCHDAALVRLARRSAGC